MPEANPGAPNTNHAGCIVLAVVSLVFVIWLASSQPSSSDSTSPTSLADINSAAATDATDAAPQLPMTLDVSSARRGYAQFKMVAAATVPDSSEIFSRNCYEAIGKFDWHQLDRCGAYDALAVRWTELNEDVAGNDDLTYFQSEAAATRYLQAATSGGLTATEADNRWTAIQRMAEGVRLAAKAPEATVIHSPVDETDLDTQETPATDSTNGTDADK